MFHLNLKVLKPSKNKMQLQSTVDARNMAEALRELAKSLENLDLEHVENIEVKLYR
ncbi:hypothetical protein SEA_PEPPERWOOD_122 [Streptomyces phage Pepperwood]|nr:hypothetical protein SEA_PEPPERWOOD_122 [Streptomyces phage Pepperwood]